MSNLRILINGALLGEARPVMRENGRLTVRVEGEGLPLDALTLRAGGLALEGAFPAQRPGGIEWRFEPGGTAGLLPLRLTGPGVERSFAVQVEPAKLTWDEYQSILTDLRRVAHSILYAIYAPTHQGLARRPPTYEPVTWLLERFEWLAQSGAAERVLQLAARLNHHTVIKAFTTKMPRDRVRRLPMAAIHQLAHHPERRHTPAIRKAVTEDCFENRVVKLLLQTLRSQCQAIAAEAAWQQSSQPEGRELSGAVAERLKAIGDTVAGWERRLTALLRADPWPMVSGVVALHQPSMVFVKDPVYRELLQWYRRLQEEGELVWADQAFTLPLRDLPTLYELWCFVQVVHTLQDLLGEPGRERGLFQVRRWGFEFSLGRGAESEVHFTTPTADVTVAYNRQFTAFTGLRYFPDISLSVRGRGLIVLDAKYRRTMEDRSYKQDDIDKMHTYRDALGAASAFILYPGEQFACWGDAAVGAIPLLPNEGTAHVHLRETLGRCLERLGVTIREGS